MTLWNIIRDWFVQYIWGGVTSNGEQFGVNVIGIFFNNDNVDSYTTNTADYMIKFSGFDHGGDNVVDFLSLGDWLSTTSTIIVLIGLCVFFYFIIRYLFRLTSGLIRGH